MIEGGSDLLESPSAEREWIAVDLALRPGYSGGPLVDHQGKLIGMSTLMAGLEVGHGCSVSRDRGVCGESHQRRRERK